MHRLYKRINDFFNHVWYERLGWPGWWFDWLGWRVWWEYAWPIFPCIRTCGDSVPLKRDEPLNNLIQRSLHLGPLVLHWYIRLPLGQYDDYRKYDRWGRRRIARANLQETKAPSVVDR